MATRTAPRRPGQVPPPSRWRAPATALLVILAAVAGFAGAFLLTHRSKAAPPPAHTVTAKITAGPTAAKISSEFPSTPIAALHRPKPKPRPKRKPKHRHKATTPVTSASSTGNPAVPITDVPSEPVESAPAYTPTPSSDGDTGGSRSASGGTPKAASGGASSQSSGGVITVGG